ncbi:MAG TPA: PKD domain-containing protein [Thermoplasmata archaeon]|nr:PKD domain-containing protein [Thermoplasmata archaeon]
MTPHADPNARNSVWLFIAVALLLLASTAGLAAATLSSKGAPASASGGTLWAAAWSCPSGTNGTWVDSNVTAGPAPLAVAFCAHSNVSGVSYSWFFGDGGHTTGASVTHTFTAPGAYDVRVEIVNGSFNATLWRWVFATGGAPVPLDVSLSATPAVSGTYYSIDVSAGISNCGGYCWINWTYSNATFTSAPTAMNNQGDSYEFTAVVPSLGNWTVSVTAGDPLGDTGNASALVDVSTASDFRVLAIGATPASGPAPLATTLFVNYTGAVGNVSATWTFGDGGNGSGLQVLHTYTAPGSYIAVARLVDGAGDVATGQVEVNVTSGTSNGSRVTLVLNPVRYYGNAPFTVELLGTVSGGVPPYLLAIDWGNGLSPTDLHLPEGGFGFNYTYASAGNFTVVATATDSANETAIVTFSIGVGSGNPLTTQQQFAFTSAPGAVAAAAIVDVFGGTPPYTIQYVWGDGAVSSAANGGLAVHLYTATGQYRPYANVTDASGSTATVVLGDVNVTAGNGTSSALGGGGLLPSGAGGWGMVSLAAAAGVGVGIASAVAITFEGRRRVERKEGERIARALETEATTGDPGSPARSSEDVKPK